MHQETVSDGSATEALLIAFPTFRAFPTAISIESGDVTQFLFNINRLTLAPSSLRYLAIIDVEKDPDADADECGWMPQPHYGNYFDFA